MASTEKAGLLVILQPKPSITCKGCILFLCEKQNEKNLQVNNLISCTYLVKMDDMICSGVKYEFNSMPNSFGNHLCGALRLWELTKEMTRNNPVMILDTNPS